VKSKFDQARCRDAANRALPEDDFMAQALPRFIRAAPPTINRLLAAHTVPRSWYAAVDGRPGHGSTAPWINRRTKFIE